jgi:hypothetical protein
MKFTVIAVLLILVSCASHKSFNQTKTGKVVMRGGIYQHESWDDLLVFKRGSWYHGMQLYYDALLWKADPESPFYKWFSPQEKEYFTKCESLIVTANYSADPAKISHVNFREQMRLNGYDDVVLNNFAQYLRTHPASQEWRVFNYKIMGYCKRSPSRLQNARIEINFPSFNSLELAL